MIPFRCQRHLNNSGQEDNLRESVLLTLKDSWGELGVSKQVGFDKRERGFGNSQWLRSGCAACCECTTGCACVLLLCVL